MSRSLASLVTEDSAQKYGPTLGSLLFLRPRCSRRVQGLAFMAPSHLLTGVGLFCNVSHPHLRFGVLIGSVGFQQPAGGSFIHDTSYCQTGGRPGSCSSSNSRVYNVSVVLPFICIFSEKQWSVTIKTSHHDLSVGLSVCLRALWLQGAVVALSMHTCVCV